MDKFEFKITEQHEGERLDKVLCVLFSDKTRNFISKLIEQGLVVVNGKQALKSLKVKKDDIINVTILPPLSLEANGESIPLDIVYEDTDLIVVNKPKGLVVHPAHGNLNGTLVNALVYHCGDSLSGINGILRPGIVHRIDKDTSGLIVAAKNDKTHTGLAAQFKAHSITRQYHAIAFGNLKQVVGTIDLPIGRHPANRKKMAVTEHNSKNAVTHYKVISTLNGFCHLLLQLETGRTHQIRVHMSHIGHFILGDMVYGRKVSGIKTEFEGQCLHAKTLGFIHPITAKQMYFDSELPDYFKKALTKLG